MRMHINKAGQDILPADIQLFITCFSFRTPLGLNGHSRITNTDNIHDTIVFNDDVYRTNGWCAFAIN